jgi:large subunit ribosomal protein L23
MSNIFKKIISGDKKKDEGKEKDKVKKETPKKEVPEKRTEKKVAKKNLESSVSHGYSKRSILKEPLITEKSRDMSVNGKYVFSVSSSANKSEVKKEVQRRYGVTVEKVNIIKKGIRPKQFRGREGKVKMQKKAVVTLREGDSIEIFPV